MVVAGGWSNETGQRNMFTMLTEAFYRARDRIARLNQGQKKVLFGMVFFLLVNAVILVISVILISKLVNKL